MAGFSTEAGVYAVLSLFEMFDATPEDQLTTLAASARMVIESMDARDRASARVAVIAVLAAPAPSQEALQ